MVGQELTTHNEYSDTIFSFFHIKELVNILSRVGKNLVSEPFWSSLDLCPVQILELSFGGSQIFLVLCLALANTVECGFFLSQALNPPPLLKNKVTLKSFRRYSTVLIFC